MSVNQPSSTAAIFSEEATDSGRASEPAFLLPAGDVGYRQAMEPVPLIFLVLGLVAIVAGFVWVFSMRKRMGGPPSQGDVTRAIVLVGAGCGVVVASIGTAFYN